MKLFANPPTARARFTGSRGAFTLIELLVVIAIISLLLAVLLPSLRSAKQRAKQAACLSNLRHLALAWREYLDENDGAFLQWINANYNYGGQQGTNQFPWPPFLGPYDAIPKPLNRYVGGGPSGRPIRIAADGREGAHLDRRGHRGVSLSRRRWHRSRATHGL